MPTDFDIQSLVQFGLTGLIIWVIIKPVLEWFMRRADKKDEHIQTLIEKHFVQAEERHRQLIESLKALPENISNATTKALTTIYSPTSYDRMNRAASRTLGKENGESITN